MPLPIHQLIISAFDVHISTGLLSNPAALTPAAQFLADPDAYRKFRLAGQPLDLPHFRAFPLHDELNSNRFWSSFSEARQPAAKDVHEVLLPLRCRPKSFDVWVRVPPMAHPVRAHATVWLWPFGWSSVVEFSIRTPLGLDDVRAVSEALRGGLAPPFTVDGTAKSLSDLFKALSADLQQDIALPGKTRLPPPAVSRQVVFAALPPTDAQPLSYRPAPGLPRWSDADRARMHGALLAQTVTLPQLIARERGSEFLLAEFPGHRSFTLTDFDRGSLLMLWPVLHLPRRRDRFRCLAANLRLCSLVGLTLAKAVDRARSEGKGNATLEALADAAAATLDCLPDHYPNAFCRGFFGKHSGVQRARSAQAA